MLTLRRFESLAASYGADLKRWPEMERGEAEGLLQSSEQARRHLEGARSLDAIMSQHSASNAESTDAREREIALTRLRSAVARRIANPRAPEPGAPGVARTWRGSFRRVRSMPIGTVGLASGVGLTIAAGLFVGWIFAPGPRPADLISLLETAPIGIFNSEHDAND